MLRNTSPLMEQLEHRQLLSTVQPVTEEPLVLASSVTDYPFTRQVVADANGDLVATWIGRNDLGHERLWIQALHADGSPRSAPVNTGDWGWSPRVAVSGDGTSIVVTWWGATGFGSGDSNYVRARIFSLDPITEPDSEHTVAVGLDNPYFTVAQTQMKSNQKPVVAMADDGRFTIAWRQSSASDSILAQRYSRNGSAIGSTMTFGSGGAKTSPSIDMDGSGRFVISWTANDKSGTGIFAHVLDANGKSLSQKQVQVNAVTAGDQRNSTVAFGPGGSFVVAWEGPDADGAGIYVRRFTSSGQPIGNDVRVNHQQAGNQLAPALDVGLDGSFVVSWSDRHTSRIYVQAFRADGSRIADGDGEENIMVSGSVYHHSTSDVTIQSVEPNRLLFFVIWLDRESDLAMGTDMFGSQYEIL